MKKTILISFIILISNKVNAQVNVKLMPNDSMKVFSTNGISIWGNFYNSGNSSNGGSLILQEGANVIMYGDSFKNVNATDVLGGGEIIMTRPRPLPYPSSGLQIFDGGGVNSSIPDLTVNSPNNVILKFGDLKVRDSIKFIDGHIILNKRDLILGNGTSGIIIGYDENKFIVTDGNTRDTNKGYFIREAINNNNYVFPVGHSIGDYTPAIINNSGTIDVFKVRAFDTVYEDGYLRNIANSFSISADERSVKRTWDIREETKGGSNVNLTLQYNIATEGSSFNYGRNNAFISHFVGYAPNSEGDTISNWKWDNFMRSSTSTPTSPGTITTGSSIGTAAMKTRSNITSFSPFTITNWEIAATPLPIHFLAFNAQWKNNTPYLNWVVDESTQAKSFTIFRSSDNQIFEQIGNIPSLNSNIQNYQYLDYSFPKNASKLYYKIRANEPNDNSTMSEIRTLNTNQNNITNMMIYPNPATQKVNIVLDNSEQNNITVTDITGKTIFNMNNNNQAIYILDVAYLAEGTYMITVENSLGKTSTKLVVIH